MAKLHFYLEKRNRINDKPIQAECPVILSFSYSSFRIKTYTGHKISEKAWDKETERVKPVYSGAERYNDYLELLAGRVYEYYEGMVSAGGIPDAVQFQKEIKRMVKSEVPLFFNLLLRFIEENSPGWSLSSYKKMKTFYSQLKSFSLKTGRHVLPGSVNQSFADELIIFYREKGLKDTTIRKNLDLLKWFMNWCVKRDLVFNRDFEHIRFSPVRNNEEHNDTFLKWDELIDFYSSGVLTKKEEWCRDIFCLVAFSGIRFSKISNLPRDCIKGSYILISAGGKTKEIFLNRFSAEICKKYENRYYRNNSMFPAMSIITFHKHLKSAAFKTGMNRSVLYRSGESLPVPLFKMISAQTAINTYFAQGARLGIPGSLNSLTNSSKSRIIAYSGSLKLAEEKLQSTSDILYASIRNPGPGPK